MKKSKQHNEYPLLHFTHTNSDHGSTRFCCYEKSMQPLKYTLHCLHEQLLLHNGSNNALLHKTQTGTVALAGKTAGGIRVCLDFFCYFFLSRKKSK